MCDRVAIVAHGRCIATGRVDELLPAASSSRVRLPDPSRQNEIALDVLAARDGPSSPTTKARSSSTSAPTESLEVTRTLAAIGHLLVGAHARRPLPRRRVPRVDPRRREEPVMRQFDAELRRFFARRIVRGAFLRRVLLDRARGHRDRRRCAASTRAERTVNEPDAGPGVTPDGQTRSRRGVRARAARDTRTNIGKDLEDVLEAPASRCVRRRSCWVRRSSAPSSTSAR